MYDNDNGNYFEIEKQLLAFSNRKKIYDQIRFIDQKGKEIVRVNYNKKSVLDLNIENDIIEQPIKPMFRISMPYYHKYEKFKGIFILNYSADDMLQQVKDVSSGSNGAFTYSNIITNRTF